MTKHSLPPLPSLEDDQRTWKKQFWNAYFRQWPFALIGFVLPAIGMAYWMAGYISIEAGWGFAAIAAVALPFVAATPAFAVSGPYPTAKSRKKLEELRAFYEKVYGGQPEAQSSKR